MPDSAQYASNNPQYDPSSPGRYQQSVSSIESNQADFSGKYRPIDAARYQTEQAQAYYERMRSEINERSKSLISRSDGLYTSGFGDSAFQAFYAGRHEPAEREYRTQRRRDRAYTRDAVERTMQAPMNFYDAFAEFGAEFGVAEQVENFAQKRYSSAGYGFLGSTSRGVATGGVAGLAALYTAEAGIKYAGIREGFEQFDEITELRGASRPMTAGTAAGPNGRMSRDMAQNILTQMSGEGRESVLERGGENLEEMKEQAGILADYQLLEGTRSADEFEKTFKRLKEGVKRVMEVMGTTFEEGAQLMKDFRNMGVSPLKGVDMINQGRLTSAQYGNNFQEGHAAGLQSSLAMRGAGFTSGAGYQMGQFASGASQAIYEGNYLDSETVYNMGGERGIQTALQRSAMRFMESPNYTAMTMGAMNQDGRFNARNVLETLSGKRTATDNAAAAGRSIDSLEDVLSYRANSRDFMSKLIEEVPEITAGLQVQSVMSMAREAGRDPSEMSTGQLAQFAGTTGMMTPNQFKANAAVLESLPETVGRRRREERRTAESRAQDMHRTGFFDQFASGLRETPAVGAFIRGSAAAVKRTRDNIYDAQQSITEGFTEFFTGRNMVTANADIARFSAGMDDIGGDIQVMREGLEIDSGRFVDEGPDQGQFFVTGDEMEQYEIGEDIGRNLENMSDKQIKQLGLSEEAEKQALNEGGRLVNPEDADQSISPEGVEPGTYYIDENDFFEQNGPADIISQMGLRNDTIDPVLAIPDERIHRGGAVGEMATQFTDQDDGDIKMELTPEEVRKYEEDKREKGYPDFELEGRELDNGNLSVSYSQMAEQGGVSVEGEPAIQQGDDIAKGFMEVPFAGGLQKLAQPGTTGDEAAMAMVESAGNVAESYAGSLSALTDESVTYVFHEDDLEDKQDQDQRMAENVVAARESLPDEKLPTREDLSDEGQEAYDKLTVGGFDRDSLEKIQNDFGEDGVVELRSHVEDRIQQAYGIEIDAEKGTPEYREQINDVMEREGVQEGFGLYMDEISTQFNLEKPMRRLETSLTLPDQDGSPQQIDDYFEQARGAAESAAEELFGDEGKLFGLVDSNREVAATEIDTIQALAIRQRYDPEDLSSKKRAEYEEITKGLREQFSPEELDALTEEIDDQLLDDDLGSLQEFNRVQKQMVENGTINGGGKQTVTLGGPEQRIGNPNRDAQEQIVDRLFQITQLLGKIQDNFRDNRADIRN